MTPKTLIAVTSLGLLACTGMAATPGQQIPLSAHGSNVSLVPQLIVNVDVAGAGEIISVSDHRGTLLFSVIAGGGAVRILPVGTHKSLVVVSEPAAAGEAPSTKDVTYPAPVVCPCNAAVIYDGPGATVIGIFDHAGNLVSVHVILKNKPS